MEHLQVSVLALRETIDRQEHRIEDLTSVRDALFIYSAVATVLLVAIGVVSCQ